MDGKEFASAERENPPEGQDLEAAMARAYRVYQRNIRETGELIYRLTRGARDGASEEELLDIACQALEKCICSMEELPEET